MQRLTSRLLRLLSEEYCPLYPVWWIKATEDKATLRRWASRCQGRGSWRWLRRLYVQLLTLTWPLRLLHMIWQTGREYAPAIVQRTGKSRWRQAVEQLCFGLGHALPPVAYYTYEFYRSERHRWIDHYLHQYEAAALLPMLNRDRHHPAIADKAEFARFCAEHSLPTPPLLAHCEAGSCQQLEVAQQDLFLKPRWGARGEGAQLWQRLDANRYQDQCGRILSGSELLTELASLSQQQAYLVQPCLTNHPTLVALSPGALATARVVTGRTPSGDVEAIVATFKMAGQPSIINTHGLNSPISLVSGQLGRAYSYHPICPGYDVHPVTGALITGVTLPDWSQTVGLAQRAHSLITEYIFLGWDVAFTPRGPVLLEGNAGWDVVTVQKPQGIGLAQTRFSDICGLWIQAPPQRE
ncbi:MAG: sugar-transfer associated ATP-grasp domain-containing protein [Caldilineaceae bacterium]